MRLIPWAMTIALALAVAWSLFFQGYEAPGDKALPTEQSTESEASPELTRAGSVPAPAKAAPDQDPDWVPCKPTGKKPDEHKASLATCLQQPAVRKHIDATVRHEIEKRGLEEPAVEPRLSQPQAQLRDLLLDGLLLSEDEFSATSEFACALQQLRWQTLKELSDAGDTPAAAVETLQNERLDVLRQMEQFLGLERYQRFRQLGGIGLLNDIGDCDFLPTEKGVDK
jgi:hypothetical protein